MAYTSKTVPKGKQAEVIATTALKHNWALLAKPGTGKTKMALDTAGLQHAAGVIEGLIVVAPNNVHRQWVDEGVPTHLGVNWVGGALSSDDGVRYRRSLEHVLFCKLTRPALRILTISFEGLQTKGGEDLAHRFAKSFRCLLVVDEAHRVCNPKSIGWNRVVKLRTVCGPARIMTGTAIKQNPFSAFGLYELLGKKQLGYATFASFKAMYARMLPKDNPLVRHIMAQFKAKTGKNMPVTPQVIATDADGVPLYRNLGHLRKRMELCTSFLTLEDVNGAEPVITRSKRLVQMHPEQRRIYNELVDTGVLETGDTLLTADGALALSIRLAQCVGGFLPNDDDPNAVPIVPYEENPKLVALLDLLDELGTEKVVIWCRYSAEIDAVAKLLGNPAVQYHGRMTSSQKAESKRAFIEEPFTRYFVGQVKAGGTGLDRLQTAANYMVFYSNEYSAVERTQAEARLARTGLRPGGVTVYDLMMEESIDDDIVRCMQTGQDVSAAVLSKAVVRKWG